LLIRRQRHHGGVTTGSRAPWDRDHKGDSGLAQRCKCGGGKSWMGCSITRLGATLGGWSRPVQLKGRA